MEMNTDNIGISNYVKHRANLFSEKKTEKSKQIPEDEQELESILRDSFYAGFLQRHVDYDDDVLWNKCVEYGKNKVKEVNHNLNLYWVVWFSFVDGYKTVLE